MVLHCSFTWMFVKGTKATSKYKPCICAVTFAPGWHPRNLLKSLVLANSLHDVRIWVTHNAPPVATCQPWLSSVRCSSIFCFRCLTCHRTAVSLHCKCSHLSAKVRGLLAFCSFCAYPDLNAPTNTQATPHTHKGILTHTLTHTHIPIQLHPYSHTHTEPKHVPQSGI